MKPGEILTAPGEITLNANRPVLQLVVANTGDRPIQVGSHYHFFETNAALRFDREASRGHRLDIPAGTAVRFEPGQSRTVDLVPYAGDRRVFGFRGLVMGELDPPETADEAEGAAEAHAASARDVAADADAGEGEGESEAGSDGRSTRGDDA